MRLSFFFMIGIGSVVLVSCDNRSSTPPELMKATTQFESKEARDEHISTMRNHHMDMLKHQRDDTVQEGIRTEQASLTACINCHVPVKHEGEVLRHDDEQHFCTTCHNYVAVKINCFECHVDHPTEIEVTHKVRDDLNALENVLAQHQKLTLGKQAKRWGVQKIFSQKDNTDHISLNALSQFVTVKSGAQSE